MVVDNISPDCKRILDKIENNNKIIKKIISQKDEKIKELEKQLELSKTGQKTAEDTLVQIREGATAEIRNAYEKGYKAAIESLNPSGGTTNTNDDKKLILSN